MPTDAHEADTPLGDQPTREARRGAQHVGGHVETQQPVHVVSLRQAAAVAGGSVAE